jgi:hypothetical protein
MPFALVIGMPKPTDIVERAGKDSFPASDPPAIGRATDPERSTPELPDAVIEPDEVRHDRAPFPVHDADRLRDARAGELRHRKRWGWRHLVVAAAMLVGTALLFRRRRLRRLAVG